MMFRFCELLLFFLIALNLYGAGDDISPKFQTVGSRYGTLAVGPESAVLTCTGAPAGAFGVSVVFPVDAGQSYRLTVAARMPEQAGSLNLAVRGKNGKILRQWNFPLTGQWSDLCLPFQNDAGDAVTIALTTDGAARKTELRLAPLERLTLPLDQARRGSFMHPDEFQSITIPYAGTADRVLPGRCNDVAVSGKNLYVLANRTLYLFDLDQDGTPRPRWDSGPIGDLRQMELAEDGKSLVIAARGAQGFVFDLSAVHDTGLPEARRIPRLASRLDTLELASGIALQGGFCFVADRVFGVSIFDLRDLARPRYLAAIRSGETQNVTVANGYLYAGIWKKCCVKVYDVRDPAAPREVAEIPLSGRGDGVAVRGRYLYAATGHHRPGESRPSAGFGLDNGMEIYDISDPAKPIPCSVTRADGAFHSNPDIWRVTVSDDGRYACLSSSFCGMYQYDVTDPRQPVRMAHYNIAVPRGGTGYAPEKAMMTSRDLTLFPYDPQEERRAAIVDCAFGDGTLYLCSYYSGLYRVPAGFAAACRSVAGGNGSQLAVRSEPASRTIDFRKLGFPDPRHFQPEGQIWAVTEAGGRICAAAGADGIYLLDRDLKQIGHHRTAGNALDIKRCGDRILVAEGTAGMGIYQFASGGGQWTEIGRYLPPPGGSVRDLAVAPGGRFVLIQEDHYGELVDLTDPAHPEAYPPFRPYRKAMVYHRQISSEPLSNRYLLLFATARQSAVFLDFGENGSAAAPTFRLLPHSGLGTGVGAAGDRFAATLGNRLVTFDADQRQSVGRITPVARVDGMFGVPRLLGTQLFVSGGRTGSLTVLDWSRNGVDPAVLFQCQFPTVPGVPIRAGDRIYLPLGYGGLLSFDARSFGRGVRNPS